MTIDRAHIYSLDRRAIGVFLTNDGQVITFVAWPVSELAEFRADVERALADTLDLTGDLGERIRAGVRVGPVRATTDLPNVIRQPFGPGWALAGDAGLVMDPITGQGMGHALRDAELLSDALVSGLGGTTLPGKAMRRYACTRDAQTKPMYDFTVRLASFEPPGPERLLFAAIAAHPEKINQFFGTFTGSVPMTEFFSPRSLIDLVGVRGFAKLACAQQRAAQSRPAPQTREAASAAQ